jgi:2-C-methyl-D-erythritol 2,4-cyclodiphosphate synthase
LVNNIALAKGFIISNLDTTIICDSPEIRKYKDGMISNIANILCIDERNISVKGKTTEGTIAKDGIISLTNVLLRSLVG